MIDTNPQIILASASPRRQELLRLLCPSFLVQPADVDESLQEGRALCDEIVRLATDKAKSICETAQNAVVIGSDTMVTIDGMALGKPQDAEDAKRMLRLLSGRTHEVLTAVAVVSADGQEQTALNTTRVTFYPLTEAEIVRYVATGEPMDKAGAYGIQGLGSRWVQEMQGDYYSVMGLPVAQLYRLLRARGIIE